MNYSISLTMSASDVAQLQAGEMSLCVLRACQATVAGYPVVWYSTQTYGTSRTLAWSESYGVFSAAPWQSSSINPTLSVTDLVATNLGQLWQVTNPKRGELTSQSPPPSPDSVALWADQFPWVLGAALIAPEGADPVPAYAFSVLPNYQVVIESSPKAILYFDAALTTPGTLVTRPYSKALLVDLSIQPSAQVVYDLVHGWDQNTGPQFTGLDPEEIVSAAVVLSHQLVK